LIHFYKRQKDDVRNNEAIASAEEPNLTEKKRGLRSHFRMPVNPICPHCVFSVFTVSTA